MDFITSIIDRIRSAFARELTTEERIAEAEGHARVAVDLFEIAAEGLDRAKALQDKIADDLYVAAIDRKAVADDVLRAARAEARALRAEAEELETDADAVATAAYESEKRADKIRAFLTVDL